MSPEKVLSALKAALPPPVDSDSDSDAPEETTQAEARERALNQRSEERQVHVEERRRQKQVRRDRQAAAAEAAKQRDKRKSGADQTAEGTADGDGDIDSDGDAEHTTGRGEDEDEDLLPESVLHAVAAKEALAAAETATLSRRAQKRTAKRQRLQVAKNAVVKVKVLSKVQARTVATNFIKEALYNQRINRSADMLSKAVGRPAAKFA